MLNAATTMKCFGRAKESIPLFSHVSRVYSNSLAPADYRFPGLYNNMALSYADVGDIPAAERYFKLALKLIAALPKAHNDMAVTYCNMAEMYAKADLEDERIYDCMEKAWDCLNDSALPRDGYHAFTISKCAPSFDYFGYFLYAKELKERAESIYAGT
jgi:tetratricopeptide (TPR) repeat protein